MFRRLTIRKFEPLRSLRLFPKNATDAELGARGFPVFFALFSLGGQTGAPNHRRHFGQNDLPRGARAFPRVARDGRFGSSRTRNDDSNQLERLGRLGFRKEVGNEVLGDNRAAKRERINRE